MPDTTPLPERPREGCTENVDHWHDGEGTAHTCTRQLGRAILSAILTRRRPDEVRTMTAEFAELRRLLANIGGHWQEMPSGYPADLYGWEVHELSSPGLGDLDVTGGGLPEGTARLIAAAVNALPALLDAAAERDALAAFAQGLQVATDSLRAERDALAAKVERVRAMPAKHPAGGWYMTSMRDVFAALDEEPQP